MRTIAIVLGSVVLAVALVAGGLWAGSAWAQGRWSSDLTGYGSMARGVAGTCWAEDSIGSGEVLPCAKGWEESGMTGPGMMGGRWSATPGGAAGEMPCGQQWQGNGTGPSMMGDWDWESMPCGGAYAPSGKGEIASLEDVEATVHDYVERLGYTGLEVTEVMEFERNYYAIVAEEDTGIGAMEVLVDKDSGAVGPEPGPNMMWNAEYGMMGRGGGMGGMMGGYATGEMNLSPADAVDVAQDWLDANLPGRAAGEADPFYGYYTLHFLNDGEIEGMLSVHGSSGDVWYHSWHGGFVTMIEGHD